MSEASNVAEQTALISVAALSFAAPAAMEVIAPIAVPAAILATIGIRLQKGCAKHTCETAIEAALSDLKAHPELTETDFLRARTLLEKTSRPIDLTPGDLVEAADSEGFTSNLANRLLQGVDFEAGDDAPRTILTLAFRRCVDVARRDKAFRAELTETLLLDLSQEAKKLTAALSRVETNTDVIRGDVAELKAMVQSLQRAQEAEQAGIGPQVLIDLARRMRATVDNTEDAMRELTRAVDIAIDLQERGRQTSNHPDFIDTVLKRAAELSAKGEYEQVAEDIDAALEEDQARFVAGQIRLLDMGIQNDLLIPDPESAAKRIVQKADLRAGGPAEFDTLRAIQEEWQVRGRDKGLVLDQEVAIALAEIIVTRATTDLERGIAFDDLGVTLCERGERESGTDKLTRSIEAFNSALKSWPREEDPMRWAATQNNLGNALRTLGQRESGTERLEQAVAAYEEALKEWTRDRVPLDWAATQNNLGTALLTLGERESGTERLEQAVAAFQDALKEYTRDRVPLYWATTQNNLGNTLLALGQRESGTERLEQAVAACQAALKERTRDRVPLDWAQTHGNLASVEWALFDKTGDTSHLDREEEFLAAAREVFEDAGATYYLEIAESIAAKIAQRRASTKP